MKNVLITTILKKNPENAIRLSFKKPIYGIKTVSMFLVGFALLFSSCKEKDLEKATIIKKENKKAAKPIPEKVKVLNFATFHMGFTSDATSVKFDEHNKENQRKVHEIAKMIAEFKPTVILVEWTPWFNKELQTAYNNYLKNPKMSFKNPSEVELLAYEVGRLSGTKRIYGIDHKMEYNYKIGSEIENKVDAVWYDKIYKNPYAYFPEMNLNEDKMNLRDKLIWNNTDAFLDFAILLNAEMLTHAGTEEGFEGADEAAKYYQRNLRMYSNLNRIQLDKNDRVFILSGASHAAFFREFMSRSPKYKMVNTFDYLK